MLLNVSSWHKADIAATANIPPLRLTQDHQLIVLLAPWQQLKLKAAALSR